MTDAEKAAAEALAAKQLSIMSRTLAKILGKKVSEIETIASTDAGFGTMTDLHNTTIESTEETGFENGLKKVTGEVSKALKVLGYTDKIAKLDAATITTIVDHFRVANPDAESDTPETASALKTANAEIARLKGELKTKETTHAEELATVEKANEKSLRQLQVKGLAEKALDTNKAIIPEDADLAGKKKDRYLKDIELNDYEFDSKTNTWYLTDGEGNRIKENGHPVKLDDKLGELVDVHFGRLKADPKDGGGLPDDKADGKNPGGGGNPTPFTWKAYTGTPPKTKGDLQKLLNDIKTPMAQQKELLEYSKTANLPEAAPAE